MMPVSVYLAFVVLGCLTIPKAISLYLALVIYGDDAVECWSQGIDYSDLFKGVFVSLIPFLNIILFGAATLIIILFSLMYIYCKLNINWNMDKKVFKRKKQ